MAKHLGAYSSLHGPAGKALTDYVEANIPQLWNRVPERITNVRNTGTEYVGDIFGYTPADPFVYTGNKFFFFSPHVHSGLNPRISINGLPLIPLVEPTNANLGTGTTQLPEGYLAPGNDYLLWFRANKMEVILNLRGIATSLRNTTKVVQQIRSDEAIAQYQGNADVLETAGFSSAADAGGKLWYDIGIPDFFTSDTPSYFRRQRFDGNWYEAVSQRTIHAETIGIFGNPNTDVAGELTEIMTWLGTKGGGRIILPPGTTRCDSTIRLNVDGVTLSGTSLGNNANGKGSTLWMKNNATVLIGARVDLGELRSNNIAVENLALRQDPTATAYFFTSVGITGLRFSNLQLHDLWGFHYAGTLSSIPDGTPTPPTPNSTNNVIYENIGGGLMSGSEGSFVFGVNFANFVMRNCVISGGQPVNNLTNMLYLPANASNFPRIASIESCSFASFGRGIRCNNSLINLSVANTVFTDIGLTGVYFVPDQSIQGVRFSNCTFSAHNPPVTGQIGALIADGGPSGFNSRLSFNACQFLYWGKRAIELQDRTANVHISNCQFEDNCAALDNATDESVINVASGTDHLHITGNQIYKRLTTGVYERRPVYGINVLSSQPHLVITNNQIDDGDLFPDVAGNFTPVHNALRGPAHLRKIYNNTKQVFEGQVVSIGPWVGLNIPTAPEGPLTFTAALPLANVTGLYHTVLQRRGKVISIAARANGNITGPTNCITFNVTKNTVNFGQSCTNIVTPVASCFDEDIDGNDFLPGDRLGVSYTITNAYIPAGLDWSVFLSVYFD